MSDIHDHRNPAIICCQEDDIKELRKELSNLAKDMSMVSVWIEQSKSYRKLVVGTAISLAISILGGIYTAGQITFYLGQYANQIKIDTERISQMEQIVWKK